MKIAMVTPIYPPHQGGIEIITEFVVNELQRRGHEVTVFTPRCMDVEKNNLPVIKHLINYIRAMMFIRTIRGSWDIIHVQQIEASLFYSSLLKRRYPGVPIVVTCHALMITDCGPEYVKFSPSVRGFLRFFFMVLPAKYLEKRSLQHADRIIAIADMVTNACSEFVARSLITTVPNGISLDEFPVRENGDIINTPYRILCPGRLATGKGQIYLVDALPEILKVLNVTVIFTGRDAAGYKTKMVTRAKEVGVLDKIQFLDGIDFKSLVQLQLVCDIVVIPSLEESFGMSILENMTMGNVIVSTTAGGIPNLITNGISGLLVEPCNPDQLACAIIEGLSNNRLREQIHNNAIEVAKKYSIRTTVDKVEEVYSLGLQALSG